ncbi:MAG: hypothetical protein ACK4TA_07625 [Saprospiraceae bacterium]
MRIAYAWLLLVLVLSNWVGGFVFFEISYLVEIRHSMNAAEQTIAETVQGEIGSKSVVKILDSQQVIPKGNVYGDFAFATEVNGETVYYTLLENDRDLQEISQQAEMPTSSNDEHNILLKSLFTEFEITQPNYLLSSVLTPSQTNFYYQTSFTFSGRNVLTPPPNYS